MTRSLCVVAALVGCYSAPHSPSTPKPGPDQAQMPGVAAPVASPAPASAAARPPATSADRLIGTAHPVMVDEIADDGSWMVLCQARHDTDGDGTISVGFGMHGAAYGDRLDPY